ncbi:MAG: ABC transporter substrate-binding protein [Acetivibrionales bacterium]
MKKFICVLLSVLMLAMLFSACSGGSNSGDSKTAAQDQNSSDNGSDKQADDGSKIRVRILTRYSNPENVREKVFMDFVKKFQDENPDILLEDMSIADESARDTKFKTSVASGDPIEIFNFLGYAANVDYIKNGVVQDISKLLEEDPEWAGAYKEPLFGPVKYDSFGISGIYGVPTAPYGVAMFYNKKIFNDLGLEIPETWEDILEVTPKLVENGITPVAFGAKDNYRGGHFLTALSMKRYGQDLKDRLISGETKWNDPDTVEMIQFVQNLYEKGVFGKDNLAYNVDAELSMLANGQAAMGFQGSWQIGTINTFENADDIICKGFPYLRDYPQFKDMWMGGPDDFMSISSKEGDKDYEATVRVLKYFTSVDYWTAQREAAKGGVYPVNLPDTDILDRLTKEFNEAYDAADNMIGEIEQYDTMQSLMDIVRTEMQTIFAGDSAQDIADRIQQEVDNYRAVNE